MFEVNLINFANRLRIDIFKAQKLIVGIFELPLNIGQLCLIIHHKNHPLLAQKHDTIQTLLRILNIHDDVSIVDDFLLARIERYQTNDRMHILTMLYHPCHLLF